MTARASVPFSSTASKFLTVLVYIAHLASELGRQPIASVLVFVRWRIILTVSDMSSQPQVSPHGEQPTLSHRLFLAVTWILKGLLRLGVPMGPMVLLTVRGRKSGQPRTTPVDLFEGDGRSFLVSTHRQESSNWVRNLRAAGEGVIARGHSRRPITVVELAPEDAGRVLKDVVGRRLALPMRGFVLRRTFSVPPDAPLAAFIDAANSHPVFEIIPPRAA